MTNATYRGRFAPSPTGPLHIGSLYTALASYLQAKAHDGAWRLRIDDLDPPRTVPGSADKIRRTLEALSLAWDGPVLYQSQRSEAYRTGLARLEAAGLVYPCTCSRKDLGDHAVYPGFCRHRAPRSVHESHALRLVTAGVRISFEDRVRGLVEQNLETEVGDFILYRRDHVFAYHLATVLDDAEQGITEVLRGLDLLDSTPRQIYLQRRLGLPEPVYAHVPILVDSQGYKLSKQTFAPEAETRDPGGVLFRLLNLLNQHPPAELATAPAPEILAWAVEHWDLARLQGMDHIPVEATAGVQGLPCAFPSLEQGKPCTP
ncbi:tRNA glutamyl-Q(34) synthetase GluQRS [Methylomagnum sp.]